MGEYSGVPPTLCRIELGDPGKEKSWGTSMLLLCYMCSPVYEQGGVYSTTGLILRLPGIPRV